MAPVRKGVTLATAAAGRAHGSKSSGPATEAGKLASRRNALKHWGAPKLFAIFFPRSASGRRSRSSSFS
jgi:hypothetical protein